MKSKYIVLRIISTVLFLAFCFLSDYLYEMECIFSKIIPLGFLGLILFVVFLSTIAHKKRRVILLGITIFATVLLIETFSSELFKSKKVLRAVLMDDMFGVNLTLREDSTFQMIFTVIFSNTTYKGKYKMLGNKIVFLDKPSQNGFIPDTVLILGDKIIMSYNENGKADTGYGNYFRIFENNLAYVDDRKNDRYDEINNNHLLELDCEILLGNNINNEKTISKPTIVKIFANDLDYNKYEKLNAKQEYYNLSDFQGYFGSEIKPIVEELKIDVIKLEITNNDLVFETENKKRYKVDRSQIQTKQGLILFNGKSKPIFWKGNEAGHLDTFVKEFFGHEN
jgi:hypothetical protein